MYLLRKTGYSSNVSNTNDGTTDYIPNGVEGNQRNYIDTRDGNIDYIPNIYYTGVSIGTNISDANWENITLTWENITINWENL